MEHQLDSFTGYNCMKISNHSISAWLTLDFGPRVIGLVPNGGSNLFAELPDFQIECPGTGMYSLRGGHRLWYAPEYPPLTYLPDDEPVAGEEVSRGFKVTQPLEKDSALQKSITVTLPDEDAYVMVEHKITNRGDQIQQIAPWVITMMRPGGVGIIPQQIEFDEEFGCQPNRTINLWPYTPVNSPYISFSDRYIFVRAELVQDKLKIGAPNPRGWLGYAINNTLFVKFAEYDPDAYYFDRQSSSEFYCDPGVLEMETLGSRVTLQPGETVTHHEEWRVFQKVEFEAGEKRVDGLVKELGLEPG